MPLVEVDSLVRKFGTFTAVDGVSFHVDEGELFGFLGPNGAGKTTTINMLCTLLKPTAGRATLAGFDVARDRSRVRDHIGLIFQDTTLDERLTGRQNLRFHAMLYDLTRDQFKTRSAEMLEMVELADKADEVVKTYSGGMKRRLEIARGLLHRPRVLFLDEPTIGLDPQTRRHIWDYLHRLREKERITLFLTTHYMGEAEACDRIAIIDQGRIVALDSPAALKKRVGGDLVTLRTSDDARVETLLLERDGLATRPDPEGGLIVEIDQGDRFIPRIIGDLASLEPAVEVRSVTLGRPTLEDVFLKLTGHAIRDEAADPKADMRRRHGFHARKR